MEAQKVVPGKTLRGRTRFMDWQQPGPGRLIWRAPVEVDAELVGQLFLFVSARAETERSWAFKLSLHEEEVFEWHARAEPSGHNNPPTGCPAGLPRKVRSPNHEHIWVEGLDLRCAREIRGQDDLSTHKRMFDAFCSRAVIRCEPTYRPPPIQLELSS